MSKKKAVKRVKKVVKKEEIGEFDAKALEGHTPKMDEADEKKEVKEPKEEKPKEKFIVYSYPSRSKCPRCGTVDTKATSTHRGTQYRKCLGAICRHKYAVKGDPLN